MTIEKYREICAWLRKTIEGTPWEGHIFTVGGCCRDQFLGTDIKDVDLAVDLPNGGIEFARWLLSNGMLKGKPVFFEKFGTARITLRQFPDEEIELVQTRKEKYTRETSRCPEIVNGTLEEDCFRRDFTVNTLYYDISRDCMLDMTGKALEDIRNGVLRTPLDPDTTFDDDPVRILRCLRFASRFGWVIEPKTMEALRRNIDRLQIVSRERFHTELSKVLTSDHPADAVRMLTDTGAINFSNPLVDEFVTQSRPDGKIPGVWDYQVENLRRLNYLPKERRSLAIALALLFCDLGKLRTRIKDRKGEIRYPRHELTGANMVRKMLRSMKFEPEILELVSFLILNHHATSAWGPEAEEMTDKALRSLQQTCATPEILGVLLDFLSCRDPENIGRHQRVAQRSNELVEDETSGFSFISDKSNERKAQRRSRNRRRRTNRRSR